MDANSPPPRIRTSFPPPPPDRRPGVPTVSPPADTDTAPAITPAQPLTKDDLAAIRTAESYTLHTSSTLDVGPGSVLRVYTRGVLRHADVFTTHQQILFP